jgi:hypothetical protein
VVIACDLSGDRKRWKCINNFDIVPGHAGFSILNSLLLNVNMIPCDDLVSGPIVTCTYVNAALNASSKIDLKTISL